MRKILFLAFTLCLAATASAGPLQEKNKAVARRVLEEIFNQGKFEVASEIYAPDFVNHTQGGAVDLKEDQAAARGWKQAFPDLKITVLKILAENDLVTVIWDASGTNTGEGNGLPATGRSGEIRGITVWRIADGKIREEWSAFDMLHVMRQLGLVPSPKA